MALGLRCRKCQIRCCASSSFALNPNGLIDSISVKIPLNRRWSILKIASYRCSFLYAPWCLRSIALFTKSIPPTAYFPSHPFDCLRLTVHCVFLCLRFWPSFIRTLQWRASINGHPITYSSGYSCGFFPSFGRSFGRFFAIATIWKGQVRKCHLFVPRTVVGSANFHLLSSYFFLSIVSTVAVSLVAAKGKRTRFRSPQLFFEVQSTAVFTQDSPGWTSQRRVHTMKAHTKSSTDDDRIWSIAQQWSISAQTTSLG